MNIEDAMNKVKNQPNQGETLHVVGSIEKDADGGKIRVYPDPYDMSRYVLIDPQSIAEKCSTLPSIGGRPGAVLGGCNREILGLASLGGTAWGTTKHP